MDWARLQSDHMIPKMKTLGQNLDIFCIRRPAKAQVGHTHVSLLFSFHGVTKRKEWSSSLASQSRTKTQKHIASLPRMKGRRRLWKLVDMTRRISTPLQRPRRASKLQATQEAPSNLNPSPISVYIKQSTSGDHHPIASRFTDIRKAL